MPSAGLVSFSYLASNFEIIGWDWYCVLPLVFSREKKKSRLREVKQLA